MSIDLVRGRPEDYEEVVDFAVMVFSDYFPKLLPKLYDAENGPSIMPHHFLIREDGKLRACVMSYPMEWTVCGVPLSVYGIGTVSVHPRTRRNGYMKKLMWEAIGEMEREHADLSVLSGQRQRYGYYGYERTGAGFSFTVTRTNLRHTCRDISLNGVGMRLVEPGDTEALDFIHACNEARPSHVKREKGRLYPILCSWENRPFFFTENGKPLGYLLANGTHVAELDAVGTPHASPESFQKIVCKYIASGPDPKAVFTVSPERADQISVLHGICEDYSLFLGDNMKIFSFEKAFEAFLKLKGQCAALQDGELSLFLEDYGLLNIEIRSGAVHVGRKREGSSAGALRMTKAQAQSLLLSPAGQYSGALAGLSPNVRDWFPLPVCFPHTDNV